MSGTGSGVFIDSVTPIRHGEDSTFAPSVQDIREELIDIMHGKNYVVSIDELLEHFLLSSPSKSTKRTPDIFAKVPLFKTEKKMYDHFTSTFNQSKIFPGQTFVTTAWKSDPNDSTRQAIDCGMYSKKHAPDVGKSAAGDESRRTDWSRIDLCIECKLHSTNQDPFDERKPENEPDAQERRKVLGQILSYAELVFRYQQRTFHYMLLLFNDCARVIYFDHSAMVVTKKVMYATEGAKLTEFLSRYGRLKSAEFRGNDPTAVRIEKKDTLFSMVQDYAEKCSKNPDDDAARLFKASVVGSGPLWRLGVHDEETETDHWFAVGKPHFQAPGVAGRGTRGYVALPLQVNVDSGNLEPSLDDEGQPTKSFVYLKDAWRINHPSLQKEGVVLKALNAAKVKYVPTAVCHGDLSGAGQSTLSQDNWVKLRPGETCKLKAHQHYRLVVKEVGKPLSEFDCGISLVIAILHCIQAHEGACRAGYIHRDISAGNILLWKSEDGNWYGLLNDWELAAKYVMGQPVGSEVNAALGDCPVLERTGTWQFLSAHCLNDNQRTVDIPDDLESLLHVLLYYAVRFLPHNIKDDCVGLFLYRYFDDYTDTYSGNTCGPAKYAAMRLGEIEVTTFASGSQAPGQRNRIQELLKFYNVEATQPAQSNHASPTPQMHPLNALLSTLLKWFKAYYALDTPMQVVTDAASVSTPGVRYGNMGLACDDEDFLSIDRVGTGSTARQEQDTSSTSLTTAGAGAGEPTSSGGMTAGDSAQTSDSDPRLKMTHSAFKSEIYRRVKYCTWPPGDKGPDKRPRDFVVSKPLAAAKVAVAAIGGSGQMNSTKRKQGGRNSGSNTKRRRNGK